jgi:hypothetical protein
MSVFYGYLLGAALMVGAGLLEAFLGVEAARKSLEDVAAPLSMASFRPGPSAEGMRIWSPYPESSGTSESPGTDQRAA